MLIRVFYRRLLPVETSVLPSFQCSQKIANLLKLCDDVIEKSTVTSEKFVNHGCLSLALEDGIQTDMNSFFGMRQRSISLEVKWAPILNLHLLCPFVVSTVVKNCYDTQKSKALRNTKNASLNVSVCSGMN